MKSTTVTRELRSSRNQESKTPKINESNISKG